MGMLRVGVHTLFVLLLGRETEIERDVDEKNNRGGEQMAVVYYMID